MNDNEVDLWIQVMMNDKWGFTTQEAFNFDQEKDKVPIEERAVRWIIGCLTKKLCWQGEDILNYIHKKRGEPTIAELQAELADYAGWLRDANKQLAALEDQMRDDRIFECLPEPPPPCPDCGRPMVRREPWYCPIHEEWND